MSCKKHEHFRHAKDRHDGLCHSMTQQMTSECILVGLNAIIYSEHLCSLYMAIGNIITLHCSMSFVEKLISSSFAQNMFQAILCKKLLHIDEMRMLILGNISNGHRHFRIEYRQYPADAASAKQFRSAVC